jgi:transposase InsO family protein
VLLDEAGKPARPWLTVIEDDYSRAIASFRLTFQEPTALTTALALRQAIWRKAYSDDFTDKEAVTAILRITRGNLRLIDRLMTQVEYVLLANQLQVVTKEVVETARENLIIGPN